MTSAAELPHAESGSAIPLSAADQASIDAYLGAGARAAVVFDVAWKVCGGLMVLTLVTCCQVPSASSESGSNRLARSRGTSKGTSGSIGASSSNAQTVRRDAVSSPPLAWHPATYFAEVGTI
jgi:hypothetical protein